MDPGLGPEAWHRACQRPDPLGPPRNDRRYFVAFAKKSTSALRSSAEPMRCSGILVPGVYSAGPISKSFATVSDVHTMSSFFSAAEKLYPGRVAILRPKIPASVGPARLPSSLVSVWHATQARN